jgi:hypothetical protein
LKTSSDNNIKVPIVVKLTKNTVITSAIAANNEMRFNPSILKKQLDSALRKVESYKKENSVLVKKLDETRFNDKFERFRSALMEKEVLIENLTSENIALREIARYQTKFLLTKEKEEAVKTSDPDNLVASQEKQIEILMAHIKKVNSKLAECRKTIRLTKNENDSLKYKNLRMQKQIFKVKKAFNDLSQKEQEDVTQSFNQLSIKEQLEKFQEQQMELDKLEDEMENEKKLSSDRLKNIIHQLEKSLKKQKDSFLREISTLKIELAKSLQDQRKLEVELNKRELLTKNHVPIIIYFFLIYLFEYFFFISLLTYF